MTRVTCFVLLLFSIFLNWNCEEVAEEETLPNIIWLVAEDQSPDFFPFYGDSTLRLPTLEALAADAVTYTRAYAPVPVCAPARSSIITGMYPTTLGTHNMRTFNAYDPGNQPEIGVPSYSPRVPQGVKMFTEYLRKAGYYCTNNAKEDYNFRPYPGAWDDSSRDAHWRNRPGAQPFFSVFNFGVSHESQIWARGKDSLWVSPSNVPVPPYFPDNDTIRHDLAVNYSNLGRLDEQIGLIINQLKEDGLYDNSYIFFYGDHGGPFPRHKRALYESGIRVPMLIKLPANRRAGEKDDALLSFIDLAPTLLSVAGIHPPPVMQGRALFGSYRDTVARKYIFASSDRFDEVYDKLRALRSGKFKYIRNYNPETSNALAVSYREQMPMMRSMRKLWQEGRLDSASALWFRTPKPVEELYNLEDDPYELLNLAENEKYRDTLEHLRGVLNDWIKDSRDLGRYEEQELISNWLPAGVPPQIPAIEAIEREGNFMLRSSLPDATLVWREPETENWQIYSEPLPNTRPFEAKAVRIGYQDSPVLLFEPE